METDMERLGKTAKGGLFLSCQACDKTVQWTVIISHTMLYTGRFAGQEVNSFRTIGLSPSPLPKSSKKLQKKYQGAAIPKGTKDRQQKIACPAM